MPKRLASRQRTPQAFDHEQNELTGLALQYGKRSKPPVYPLFFSQSGSQDLFSVVMMAGANER
jgi:hypothetical protein